MLKLSLNLEANSNCPQITWYTLLASYIQRVVLYEWEYKSLGTANKLTSEQLS